MKFTTITNRLTNSRGSAMLYAVLVMFFLSSLTQILFTQAIMENKQAESSRKKIQAFHLAEAGIERALNDLKMDVTVDSSTWLDGNINGFTIGPDFVNYYNLPFTSTDLNGGTYTVQLKNVAGAKYDIWIKSTGTMDGISQTIEVYVRMINLTIWNNAIFAGVGGSGKLVNGNVNVSGSVHLLGNGLSSDDIAMELGGGAGVARNNYAGLPGYLGQKIPSPEIGTYNGENVSTLNAELRVKNGKVSLNGNSKIGAPNKSGNGVKETVDGAYVTDGYEGNKGSSSVFSDNGVNNPYDLGDNLKMPSLSDPQGSYDSYLSYLKDNALVLTKELSAINPNSTFSYTDGTNSISMDGKGNMSVSGVIFVDGGNSLSMQKQGPQKTITYTGKGSLVVTGNIDIGLNFITAGNNSFPQNVVGFMTPNNITMGEAQTDIMGLFYADGTIQISKQTNLVGTIVSNYFDLGKNVPSVFQVPATLDNLPPLLIGKDPYWTTKIVLWKIAE